MRPAHGCYHFQTMEEMIMNKKFFETDRWIPVPMISDEYAAKGYTGGEACQQVLCPVLDPIEGKHGLFGTDVAGLYRSDDGGRSWIISTVGFDAAGATGAAFDPNNTKRCLIVGANSAAQDVNGLFISYDYGQTWRPVLRARTYGYRDFRTQIAFDESSFDAEIGGSAIVYWSREDNDKCRYQMNDPALYKSTDGGETWQRLIGTEKQGGAYIAVHKEKGWLITANQYGIFRSKDGAATFETVLDRPVNSIDTVRTHPDMIWASTGDGVYISKDYGDSWDCIKGENYPDFYPDRIRVSPANINNMVLEDDYTTKTENRFGHIHAFSHDGGKTWHESIRHTKEKNPVWVPSNSARSAYCWDPNDENRVICNWNYICASEDGGENFYWSNSGFNGICPGGMTKFNVNDPELIAMASQDYNGGFSVNGGKTWTYVNWTGHEWGGYTYGAYCLDENNIFVTKSDSWVKPRELVVTHDGGKTVEATGLTVQGTVIGMGAPGRREVGFMGEWRTDDYAHTWNKMVGCTGVFCADIPTGRIWGKESIALDENTAQDFIVYSDDAGESWTRLIPVTGTVTDIAYDAKRNFVYFAAGEQLWYAEVGAEECKQRLVAGFIYNKLVKSVAIDPEDSDIMYVSCSSNKFYNNRNVWRSVDGGISWICLTRELGDGRDDPDGARRTVNVAVGGKEHWLFAFSGCKGVWKMARPPKK